MAASWPGYGGRIMMFLVSQAAVWTVAVSALVAAAVLCAAEWCRPDRRWLAARLGATILAVAALALWAVRPAWRADRAADTGKEVAAVLWTPSTRIIPAPADADPRRRFALPGASFPADAGVTVLPDAATWRRRFPDVTRVRVLGDGLEPAELTALAGLRVGFDPGPAPDDARLAVCSLRCPRVLALGEPLMVQGRVAGLPVGGTATLILEAPDGNKTAADTAPAGPDGTAGFALRAPAPAAAGRWEFRLRCGDGGTDEALGVEVRAPVLPRVLILESAPRFDTAALRRWYEEAGGALRARLRVGQDRYRFFAAPGTPAAGEFDALDAPLLAGCDLVVADARALAALPAPERDLLRTAVADTGLGVLALADDAVLPPATVAPDRAWLLPWTLRAPPPSPDLPEADAGHLARLAWPGLGPSAEVPLPVPPCEIVLRPGQAGAVRDDQGRTLAAVAPCGRGTVALTLVRETGRWRRADTPGLFAGYWSALFSRVARPLAAPARWTLADGDDGPVFVDRPLEFVWSGAADAPPPAARVVDGSGAAPVALAPAADPSVPGRWRVTFWPRRAGWHRLESGSAGGYAAMDFHVSPAASWPALAVERRRSATARFAARSTDVPAAANPPAPGPLPAGGWFAAFLLGAGFLWGERRLAAGGGRAETGPPGATVTNLL